MLPEPPIPTKRKREAADDLALGRGLSPSPCKRKLLHVDIPVSEITLETTNGADESISPAFSEISLPDSLFEEQAVINLPCDLIPALRTAPPIPGLFFTPTLRLPGEVADEVMRFCLEKYFQAPDVINQLDVGCLPKDPAGLPTILLQLLSTLDTMLLPFLPPQTHELLFPCIPKHARQIILNLYDPGEGISPHVDLLRRFGDGIIGVSLGSGCTMQFSKTNGSDGEHTIHSHIRERQHWDLYLPERSVVVLSEDARYRWTHGIGKCTEDYVALAGSDTEGSTGQWIQRDVRLSITFRWLLPGADIVGED